MATVKFSAELKDKIIDNAKDIYLVKLRKLKEDMIASDNLGNEIMDILFGSTLDVQPSYMFETIKAVGIERFYNVNKENAPDGMSGDDWESLHAISLEYPLPKERCLPRTTDSDEFVKDKGCKCSWGEFRLDVTDNRWSRIKDKLLVYTANRDELSRQMEEFVDKVDKLMDSYATLAPAVKAWSGLWELVPEDYRERATRKVDRRKVDREELDKDMDFDSMTVVVAKHKLSQ